MISGKTTLLKSKAVSLARSGESVSYIVMGGSEKTESVMSIATRLDFAQYHSAINNQGHIKVISQQELTKFYWSFHPSSWSSGQSLHLPSHSSSSTLRRKSPRM